MQGGERKLVQGFPSQRSELECPPTISSAFLDFTVKSLRLEVIQREK